MAELEIIPVKINGKSYDTALYNGVQRFVPNTAVNFLVNSIIYGAGDAYNQLGTEILEGRVSLEDNIELLTQLNGSLGHFEDSLASLIDMNPEVFGKSYDELVVIENPLWDE